MVGLRRPLVVEITSARLNAKLEEICEHVHIATSPCRDFLTFLGLRSDVDWSKLQLSWLSDNVASCTFSAHEQLL